jgi:uridine kinase
MTTEPGAPAAPFVVGIAGGSGAGKSALVRAVATALGPEQVAVLAHDAYYRDGSHLEAAERAAWNFDEPQALDQDLFRSHLEALRRGRAVTPPSYCFVTHRRRGLADRLEPREVLLVEGILLFQDSGIRRLLDLRIYVDAPPGLRLARRIVRDRDERGRTAAEVTKQWRTTVFPAHDRWVEPTRASADLVLVNAGRLAAVAELAIAVIRARLETRRRQAARTRAA